MKVKRTLHEIYADLKQLRETRDIRGRLVAECLAEGDLEAAEDFVRQFKHTDEIIEYMSNIQVEYEDKYEAEEED